METWSKRDAAPSQENLYTKEHRFHIGISLRRTMVNTGTSLLNLPWGVWGQKTAPAAVYSEDEPHGGESTRACNQNFPFFSTRRPRMAFLRNVGQWRVSGSYTTVITLSQPSSQKSIWPWSYSISYPLFSHHPSWKVGIEITRCSGRLKKRKMAFENAVIIISTYWYLFLELRYIKKYHKKSTVLIKN